MNKLWNKAHVNISEVNALSTDTMAQNLQIHFTEIGDGYIKATMPVCNKTHQPHGLLHGGASAALAETIGSVASWLVIDHNTHTAVGIEINCNHLRAKKDGYVTATAEPLHIGATMHVWDIKITDEKKQLICASRLTVAVLKKK